MCDIMVSHLPFNGPTISQIICVVTIWQFLIIWYLQHDIPWLLTLFAYVNNSTTACRENTYPLVDHIIGGVARFPQVGPMWYRMCDDFRKHNYLRKMVPTVAPRDVLIH